MATFSVTPTITLLHAGSLDGRRLPDPRDASSGGLAALLLRIREARTSAAAPALLLTCGNMAGGAAQGDQAIAESFVRDLGREGAAALVLGEREIALGLSGLEALAGASPAPLLSANLLRDDGRLAFESHVIVETGSRRVAIVGLSRYPADCALPEGLVLQPAREALAQVLPAALAAADAVVVAGQFAAFETSAWAREIPGGAVFLTTTPAGEVAAPRPAGAGWTLRAASPRSLARVSLHVASDGSVLLLDSGVEPLEPRPGDAEAIAAMAARWSAEEAGP